MTNLSKWNIAIEYGPATADIYEITVQATSSKDARTKAEQWAIVNNVVSPMFGMPWQDTYEEFDSWDETETTKFLDFINFPQDINES